ncbi:MAG: hypothetical protein ACLS63_08265 [Flavonifractor plautii]
METPRACVAVPDAGHRLPETLPEAACGAGRGADGQRGHRLAHRRLRAAGLFYPAAPAPLPPRRCATMGAASACRCGRTLELTGLLARSAVPLYAAALRDDTEDIRSVPLGSAAVVIGSEGRGCPSRCWTPAGRL